MENSLCGKARALGDRLGDDREAKIRAALSREAHARLEKSWLEESPIPYWGTRWPQGVKEGSSHLTCMDGILLVEVQVRVDVGVLVVMGGHIEHLQPGQWVIAQGCHPFCVLPLSCQTLRVGHVRPQGWPSGQRQTFSLQGPQARMKRERMQARWARLQSQATMSGEGIQAWPRNPV